jgi:hypothetical protein
MLADNRDLLSRDKKEMQKALSNLYEDKFQRVSSCAHSLKKRLKVSVIEAETDCGTK